MKEEQSLRGNKKYTIIDAVKGGVRFKNSALENITEEYTSTKTTYEKEQDIVVAEIVGIAGKDNKYYLIMHIIFCRDSSTPFDDGNHLLHVLLFNWWSF